MPRLVLAQNLDAVLKIPPARDWSDDGRLDMTYIYIRITISIRGGRGKKKEGTHVDHVEFRVSPNNHQHQRHEIPAPVSAIIRCKTHNKVRSHVRRSANEHEQLVTDFVQNETADNVDQDSVNNHRQ